MSRPLPPPLDFPYPPCSICGEECRLTDDTFTCPSCGASWPTVGAPEGEWTDCPDAAQCPSTYRPWADSKYAGIPTLHFQTYRCALDYGHIDADRGAGRHVHPEWQDGWTDKEAQR